jgi:hypothetical protein
MRSFVEAARNKNDRAFRFPSESGSTRLSWREITDATGASGENRQITRDASVVGR